MRGEKMKKLKKTKKAKKLFTIIQIAFVSFLTVFLGIQIYVDLYSSRYINNLTNSPVCDAIIVPGASVYSDGTPSEILADRLRNAYALYKSNKAPEIIVSGDHRTDDYNEVDAMRDYLIKLGVSTEDIITDHSGFNTYDSMNHAKSIFKIKSLLVSTQNFHAARSVYIARKLDIDAYGCPCEDKNMYNMKHLNLRESLAKVKAVVEIEIFRNFNLNSISTPEIKN